MTPASKPAPLLARRLDSTRLLVFGGLLLILLGMVLGEVYAIFISHVVSGEIRQRMGVVVEAVVEGDAEEVRSQFATIEQHLHRRGRIVNTHSHIIAFGFLALTLALLQPLLPGSEGRKRLLAACVIAGSLLQAGFVFIAAYAGRWALYVSDIGAALLIVGVLGTLLGLLRPRPDAPVLNIHLRELLRSPSSRLLLQVGGWLILAGMVFGFYLAWLFVTRQEPQQFQLLDTVFGYLAAGQVEPARAALSAYRTLQSQIAILAAAHSHAIEFGMMAFLVAFIQNFILLSERWKLRWAWVFTVGAAMLPVFVYFATVVGLASAALADTAGFLVIFALSAMLVGLLRYTGVVDVQGGG